MVFTSLVLNILVLFPILSVVKCTPWSKDESGPYRVMRIKPVTQDQFSLMVDMWKNASFFGLDFWQEPKRVNTSMDVMIGDLSFANFRHFLDTEHILYNVTIQNVQKFIIDKNAKSDIFQKWNRKLKDETSASSVWSNFNMASYVSYDQILRFMSALQAEYPSLVQIINIGRTHEDRPLHILRVGKPAYEQKKSIWVDAGIHAREWITIPTALYFVNQLIRNYASDPQIRRLVDEVDWFIMPVMNPDGYEFTRSSVDPKVRLWRKNRSPPVCRQTAWGQECCQGVDLNRNFDFHWGETGASGNPCEEIYAGHRAFSEPETRAVADFILPRKDTFKAFVTLHSYSQIWMYPFGHQRNTYPSDVGELKFTAQRATKALQSLYDTKYTIGTGADTLYPASGGSDDWAKMSAGIKYVYLLELRPEDDVWDGFILGEDQILPTARETWEGVKAVAQVVLDSEPALFFSAEPPTSLAAPTCVDSEPQCRWWKSIGGCQIWRDMDSRCPLSCGACRPAVP